MNVPHGADCADGSDEGLYCCPLGGEYYTAEFCGDDTDGATDTCAEGEW